MTSYNKFVVLTLLFALLFLSPNVIIGQENETPAKNFDEALTEHLEAVVQRNLATYIGSISDEDVSMILPNGKLMAKVEDIKEMHEEWFEESGWDFGYKIIRKSETENMAYALLDVDYYNLDEQNTKDYRPFFLVVVFEKENGIWKLTHDQCTPNISKKIAAESVSEPEEEAADDSR